MTGHLGALEEWIWDTHCVFSPAAPLKMIRGLLLLQALLECSIATQLGTGTRRLTGAAFRSFKKTPELDMWQGYGSLPAFTGHSSSSPKLEQMARNDPKYDPTRELVQRTPAESHSRHLSGVTHLTGDQDQPGVERSPKSNWHFEPRCRFLDPVETRSNPNGVSVDQLKANQQAPQGSDIGGHATLHAPLFRQLQGAQRVDGSFGRLLGNLNSGDTWSQAASPLQIFDLAKKALSEVRSGHERADQTTLNLIDRVGIEGSDECEEVPEHPNLFPLSDDSCRLINKQPSSSAFFSNALDGTSGSVEEVKQLRVSGKREYSLMKWPPAAVAPGYQSKRDWVDFPDSTSVGQGGQSKSKRSKKDSKEDLASSKVLQQVERNSFNRPNQDLRLTGPRAPVLLSHAEATPAIHHGPPRRNNAAFGSPASSLPDERQKRSQSDLIDLDSYNLAHPHALYVAFAPEAASQGSVAEEVASSAVGGSRAGVTSTAAQVSQFARRRRRRSKSTQLRKNGSFQALPKSLSMTMVDDYLSRNPFLAATHPSEKDIPTFIGTLNRRLDEILAEGNYFLKSPQDQASLPMVLAPDHQIFRLIRPYGKRLRPNWLMGGGDCPSRDQRTRFLDEVLYQTSLRACVNLGLEPLLKEFLSALFLQVLSNYPQTMCPSPTFRATAQTRLVQGIVVKFLYHLILLHQFEQNNFSDITAEAKQKVNRAFTMLREFFVQVLSSAEGGQVPESNMFFKAQYSQAMQLLKFPAKSVRFGLSENHICRVLEATYFESEQHQIGGCTIKEGLDKQFINFMNDLAIVDFLADRASKSVETKLN